MVRTSRSLTGSRASWTLGVDAIFQNLSLISKPKRSEMRFVKAKWMS